MKVRFDLIFDRHISLNTQKQLIQNKISKNIGNLDKKEHILSQDWFA